MAALASSKGWDLPDGPCSGRPTGSRAGLRPASTLSSALGTFNKPSAVQRGEPRAGRRCHFRLQSQSALLVASACLHSVGLTPQAPWPSPKAFPVRRQGAKARMVDMPGLIPPQERRGCRHCATTPAGNPGICVLQKVQVNINEESRCLTTAYCARCSTQHFI